jgi:hypothetical protein
MANKILLKRNTIAGTAPSAGAIDPGELAYNTADGRLYSKFSSGTINEITIQAYNTANITANNVRGNVGWDLTNTGVSSGQYGSSTQVPVITVDIKGRVTSISNVSITGGGSGDSANVAYYANIVPVSTNQAYYLTFANSSTRSNSTINVNSRIAFNPSNGNLSATGFLGTHWGAVAATTANVSGVSILNGNVVAASTEASTDTTTGALVVKGGLGVAGDIYASSATISGAVYAGSFNALTYINIEDSTNSYLSTNQFDMGAPAAESLLSFNISSTYGAGDPGTSQLFLKSTSNGTTITKHMLAKPDSIEFLNPTLLTSIGPKLTTTSLDFYNPSSELVSTLNSTGFIHNGNITANSNAVSTSTTTGALVVKGGAGITGRLFVGGNTVIANTTTSTSTTTGALVVTGGVGIGGNLNVAGNVFHQSAVYETFSNITNTGGNLTCDLNNGSLFNVTSLTANVTANFTNVNVISNRVATAKIMINQGATAYVVSNVQINSSGINITPLWKGDTSPSGLASNLDIMTFSLIFLSPGVTRVVGELTSY